MFLVVQEKHKETPSVSYADTFLGEEGNDLRSAMTLLNKKGLGFLAETNPFNFYINEQS